LAVAEPDGAELAAALNHYRELIGEFVEGRLPGPCFEQDFFALYKNDPAMWPDTTFEMLDRFFADVDNYVDHDGLRVASGGLDVHQLRAQGRVLLAALGR
jgi:hypothetical protein